MPQHSEEVGEGNVGVPGFPIASDHGVPHESVGLVDDAVEEKVGVANVSGIGERAEGEEPARRERVGDEAGPGHAGMNLLQLPHGGT